MRLPAQPPEARLIRIYDQVIRPILFDHVPDAAQPVFVTLGGQPGAGKTAALGAIRSLVPNAVEIIGDDLRAHHPHYLEVMARDPLAMPSHTAEASGRWVGMALTEALGRAVNVVVEGTWRNPVMVCETASRFAPTHRVHAVVLAVPSAMSTLRIAHRYYLDKARTGSSRWTSLEAHDYAYPRVEETLGELLRTQPWLRVTVVDHRGDIAFDQDHPDAAEALAALRQRDHLALTPLEQRNWRESLAWIREQAAAQPEEQGLIERLMRDARVLELASS